jgi:hypothetical protein
MAPLPVIASMTGMVRFRHPDYHRPEKSMACPLVYDTLGLHLSARRVPGFGGHREK